MSYQDREISAYNSHPLELYRFATGSQVWLYTSGDHRVYNVDDEYVPVFITRSGFIATDDSRKATIEIEVGADNPVALLFRSGWLPGPLLVTILRHHYGDADFQVVWKGRVTGCRWSGSTATLLADSVYTLFKKSGLRRVYQVGCPHILFDFGCRLDKANWRVDSTAAEVSGNVVAVTDAATYGLSYFVGGMLQFGDEHRLVVSQFNDYLTLLDRVEGLAAGAAVSIWPGCDRSMATCLNRFSNIDNYGGLPFLPEKNPFSGDALV